MLLPSGIGPPRQGLFKPPGVPVLNTLHRLAQGLVSFVVLDGYSAVDIMGQPTTKVSPVAPGLCVGGAAATFTATSTTSAIQLPSSPALQAMGVMTVVAGIQPTSFANFNIIASRWDETGLFRSWAFLFFTGGDLHFYTSSNGAGFATILKASAVPVNTYAIVGATLDSSANGIIYVNGKNVASGALLSPLFASGKLWSIGHSTEFGSTTANSFGGNITFVGLWNRALGPGDMAALASAPYQALQFPGDVISQVPSLPPPQGIDREVIADITMTGAGLTSFDGLATGTFKLPDFTATAQVVNFAQLGP